MLIPPLTVTLDTIRASLTATEVTRATLPPEIAQDWVAKDGQALIQVTPPATAPTTRCWPASPPPSAPRRRMPPACPSPRRRPRAPSPGLS
jgi:uncharacterized protein (DUF2267 family)